MRAKSFSRWLFGAGVAAALLLLIWSALIEPRLIVEEKYEVEIPDLPVGWEGKCVGLIADPQVGLSLSNTDTVRQIVRRLIRRKPAAVFIAGDFIYEPLPDEPFDARKMRSDVNDDIDQVLTLFRPLTEAHIPTYAVLGNHDVESEPLARSRPKLLREALERAGIRVLNDESVRLRSERGDLWLVGLSSEKSRRAQRQHAIAQVPEGAARLVLLHNPERFGELPPRSAPLAMAGHTHGGQVKMPFLFLRRVLGRVHAKPRAIRGWLSGYGAPGNRLYVNRGIGFSRLPLRFNSPPEITFFTLRRAQT